MSSQANRDLVAKVSYLKASVKGEQQAFPAARSTGLAIELSEAELMQGKMNRNAARQFIAQNGGEDAITCTVYLGSLKRKGPTKVEGLPGTIYPITAQVVINREGQISAAANPPVVQGNFLSASKGEAVGSQQLAICTISDLDSYIQQNKWDPKGSNDLLKYAQKMALNLCSDFLKQNPEYEHTKEFVAQKLDKGMTRGIEKVYEDTLALENPTKNLPLLSNFLTGQSTRRESEPLVENEHFNLRLGHMSPKFGLANAQRHALTNLLDAKQGETLALNGPPGTGKTTMIQSVVGSLWVKAAIEGESNPPIIVACSTNNQAVTNILESFATAEEKIGSKFAGRWIPGLQSYGMYFKEESDDFFDLAKAQEIEGSNSSDVKEYFLEHFNKAFEWAKTDSITKAVEVMSSALKKGYKILDDIEKKINIYATINNRLEHLELTEDDAIQNSVDLERRKVVQLKDVLEAYRLAQKEWDIHQVKMKTTIFGRYLNAKKETLALFDDLVARHGLKEIEEYCGKEDAIKIADDLFSGMLKAIEEEIKSCTNRAKSLLDLESELAEAKKDLIEFGKKTGVENPEKIDIENLDLSADTSIRQPLFKLATHYWEGRWIQEMDATIWSGRKDRLYYGKPSSESELKAIMARRSMLTPCFVSTFHSLPKYLSFKNPIENSVAFNFADLLIVDESGQVTPEVGACGFALAKKALVVGDVKQIEPVWNCTESTDFYQCREAGLLSNDADLDTFEKLKRQGILASSGSLMKMAQNASYVNSDLELGRGMHLYEHRRGYDDLIAYCNELCYKNKLIPMRGPSPKNTGSKTTLPAIGYASIPGKSERPESGSRLNRLEAKMIALWVAQQLPDLIREKRKPAHEIIGIVTPFKAQSKEIANQIHAISGMHGENLQQAYSDAGLQPSKALEDFQKITTGTVHSLQGAERSVVLFSPVYSKHDSDSEYFFDLSPSMLNVAVSRAKDSFLVFGDDTIFHKRDLKPSSLLGKYMKSSEDNEIKIPVENLLREDMSDATAKRAPEFISNLEGHRNVLRKSFDLAEKDLMIVSPWVTQKVLEEDGVLEGIERATARGVKVKMFIGEDMNLDKHSPEEFKTLIQQIRSKGADLTLVNQMHQKVIYIDDSTMISGSFNWLSSSRSEKFKLMEKSIIYHSDLVKEEKEGDIKVLEQLRADSQWLNNEGVERRSKPAKELTA